MGKFLVFLLMMMDSAFLISCDFTITALNFGTYDPSNKAPTDSTSIFKVSCKDNKSINYSITCDQGTGINASIKGGRLLSTQSSRSTLTYNLYTDNYYLTILGNGISGNSIEGKTIKNKRDNCGSGSVQGSGPSEATETIFGRIPARQDSAPGIYSDTIRVTVVVG